MKTIYAITHTQSLHHVQKIGGGWYDTALTEKGRDDARCIGQNLFNEIGPMPSIIYSSDLLRCKGVAEILSEVFKCPVEYDGRLRELNAGEAGGKSKEWQEKHIRPTPDDGNRLDHVVFHGAESRRDIGARISEFVREKLDKLEGASIVVTHGFALSFLIMAWLKIPIEHMGYGHFASNSGGVSKLTEDDIYYNRTLAFFNSAEYRNSFASR